MPLKITGIPTCTSLKQGWVLEFRARVKIAESCPKTLYNLWYVVCTIYGLEKGPIALMFVHVTSKKGPYILHMLHKNFTCWKQFKLFILTGNLLLRESPFHIANCLKLFDFTLFFCLHIKVVKGPLWHIFLLYFEKHMTCSRACGSRVVHLLINKTMQKLSAKVSKRDLATPLKKGGPETIASFASPNNHPCSRLHTKEKTGFIL